MTDERRAEVEAVARALRDWRWDESGDGAATRPALEPFAEDLRCRFDPAFARARDVAWDIAQGRRDVDGRTADAIRRAENRGNSRGTFQCWECHRIGTVHSAVDTCRACGYSHGRANHNAVSVT